MKLEIKDEFPEYKTNVNTDNLPKNKITCKNSKVIHYDHCLPEDNIVGYAIYVMIAIYKLKIKGSSNNIS